jgi:hypothetical protein
MLTPVPYSYGHTLSICMLTLAAKSTKKMRTLLALAAAAAASAQSTVSVNWNSPAGVGTLKTEAALQVRYDDVD